MAIKGCNTKIEGPDIGYWILELEWDLKDLLLIFQFNCILKRGNF